MTRFSPRRALSAVWDLIVDMWREVGEDSVGDLAAAMSFFTLLSIPAAALATVTALGSLEGVLGAGLADDVRTTVTDYVDDTFASATLTETIDGLFTKQRSEVFTFSVVLALYSLSRGFAGLVRGLDAAYDIDTGRSWVDVRITALLIGLGTIMAAGGSTWLAVRLWPASATPLTQFGGSLVLILLLTAWATALFQFAPDHRTPWRWNVPGAILTATILTLVIRGFALYARAADTGNSAIGAVGAALLAATFIYLINYGILLGAELNGILVQRAEVAQPPRRLHHLWTEKLGGKSFIEVAWDSAKTRIDRRR